MNDIERYVPGSTADSGQFWRRTPYRIPPPIQLYGEVIEGEFMYEVDPYTAHADTRYLDAELVNDDLELTAGAEHPPVPEDVAGPESEKPAGVRVAWKRPTELFAEAGAHVSGRGIDFLAELSQKVTGRVSTAIDPSVDRTDAEWEHMNPFGHEAYRSQPLAPPDVLVRD